MYYLRTCDWLNISAIQYCAIIKVTTNMRHWIFVFITCGIDKENLDENTTWNLEIQNNI